MKILPLVLRMLLPAACVPVYAQWDPAGTPTAVLRSSDGGFVEGEVAMRGGRGFVFTRFPGPGGFRGAYRTGSEKRGQVMQLTLEDIERLRFLPWDHDGLPGERIRETYTYENVDGQMVKRSTGEGVPLRELQCEVTLRSGEVMMGKLRSTTIYVQGEGGWQKFTLWQLQRGKAGETLDDLVYVQDVRITHADGGRRGPVWLDLPEALPEPFTKIRALTREGMAEVPVDWREGQWRVSYTLGQDVIPALVGETVVRVGWPVDAKTAPADRAALLQAVEGVTSSLDQRRVVDVYVPEDGGSAFALMALRRSEVNPNTLEAWRVAVWRFHRDVETGELSFERQGTLDHRMLSDDEKGAEIQTDGDLWGRLRRAGDAGGER